VHRPTAFPVDVVLGKPGLEQIFVDGARPIRVGRLRIRVASATRLLVMKVLAARPKDLEDAATLSTSHPGHHPTGMRRSRRSRSLRRLPRHVALRELLVKKHQLEGVISLPSGVFKPYAGVSTAIVVFTKGGKTDNVFFYDVGADGFSLDDKRDPGKENDLPDALVRWRKKNAKKDTDRTQKHFMVPVSEIEEKGFDLSINRYKVVKHEEVIHEPPKKIIARLRKLEAEISRDLTELEHMLGEG